MYRQMVRTGAAHRRHVCGRGGLGAVTTQPEEGPLQPENATGQPEETSQPEAER
jgi:hypothetical protein